MAHEMCEYNFSIHKSFFPLEKCYEFELRTFVLFIFLSVLWLHFTFVRLALYRSMVNNDGNANQAHVDSDGYVLRTYAQTVKA